MRIEEGKYYRTRDGRKAGPAKLYSVGFDFWDLGESFDVCHEADGTYIPGRVCPDDLISEWTDEGPVRTVTRREIIPGTYDGVGVNVGPEGELFIEVTPMATRDPDRLERAAAVLTALAGALRDGK